MFDLTDKVAVVTGASSGLGADSARAYAQNGANVVLLARRKEKLEQVAAEISGMGRKVLAISCDVTDEECVKKAVEEIIEKFGRIDILLNNAGVAVRGDVDTLTVEDWDHAMDVNVKGMFIMSKYIVPHMKEQNYGKIVNISSVNALIGDKADMFIFSATPTTLLKALFLV